jgi:hypothetical protein
MGEVWKARAEALDGQHLVTWKLMNQIVWNVLVKQHAHLSADRRSWSRLCSRFSARAPPKGNACFRACSCHTWPDNVVSSLHETRIA